MNTNTMATAVISAYAPVQVLMSEVQIETLSLAAFIIVTGLLASLVFARLRRQRRTKANLAGVYSEHGRAGCLNTAVTYMGATAFLGSGIFFACAAFSSGPNVFQYDTRVQGFAANVREACSRLDASISEGHVMAMTMEHVEAVSDACGPDFLAAVASDKSMMRIVDVVRSREGLSTHIRVGIPKSDLDVDD